MWAYMYLKPKLMNVKKEQMKTKRHFRFKIGQLVRISHQRRAFTRAYNEQWSYEVFKIKRHFQMQGIPMYKLVDMLESEIKGNFYQAELQAWINQKIRFGRLKKSYVNEDGIIELKCL
jgi:hypothetical protein